MKKKLALLLAVGGLGFVVAVTARTPATLASHPVSAATAADIAGVKKTVERGELLMAVAGASNEYSPGWHGGAMSQLQSSDMNRRLDADFGAVFAQQLAQKLTSGMKATTAQAMAANPDLPEPGALTDQQRQAASYPTVRLDGGVKSVEYQKLDVSGDTASVTLKVESWATYAQVRAGHVYPYSPHNGTIDRMDLQRVNGQWMIASFGFSFVPGEGP